MKNSIFTVDLGIHKIDIVIPEIKYLEKVRGRTPYKIHFNNSHLDIYSEAIYDDLLKAIEEYHSTEIY